MDRIKTKAPAVAFKNLHPTISAGKKFKGCDLPPTDGNDGRESKYVRCKQCGHIVNTDIRSRGNGWDGNETQETISGSNAKDPVVGAGCPLCGSSEY